MTRTAADIFRAAHAATRAAVARWGCDYRATFAVALRNAYGEDTMTAEERAEQAAEDFAAAVRADDDIAIIDDDGESGVYEVRIIRVLSRRRMDVGTVTFFGNGEPDVAVTRRASYYTRLAQQCEAA